MDDKDKNLWWRPAMFIAVNVSGWIAGPIIIALIVGKYLDKKYASEPWFFIGLTIVAFIVSITGIWKILKKYIKEIEKEAKSNKIGSPDTSKEVFREAKDKLEKQKEKDDNNGI